MRVVLRIEFQTVAVVSRLAKVREILSDQLLQRLILIQNPLQLLRKHANSWKAPIPIQSSLSSFKLS